VNRFLRLLAALFPSVPPADQAIVLAAMTPAPGACGEAAPGAGHSPGGEVAPTETSPARSRSSVVEPSMPRPPANEVLLNWRAHPTHRWEFSDTHLGALVDRWRGELA
jgi:hypothetical protein